MPDFGGHIDNNNKLTVYKQPVLAEWIKKNSGKDIVLSVKVKRKQRSTPQNGYYWSVVVPMVTEAINSYGNEYSNDDTHEYLKSRFNSKDVEVGDGNYLQLPMSTSGLDTAEFAGYIDQIQQFASMVLGVYIPSPNEQLTIDHYLKQP